MRRFSIPVRDIPYGTTIAMGPSNGLYLDGKIMTVEDPGRHYSPKSVQRIPFVHYPDNSNPNEPFQHKLTVQMEPDREIEILVEGELPDWLRPHVVETRDQIAGVRAMPDQIGPQKEVAA